MKLFALLVLIALKLISCADINLELSDDEGTEITSMAGNNFGDTASLQDNVQIQQALRRPLSRSDVERIEESLSGSLSFILGGLQNQGFLLAQDRDLILRRAVQIISYDIQERNSMESRSDDFDRELIEPFLIQRRRNSCCCIS